ncbi:MAG: cysteine desulfurase-like protein [Propionicimonas sp.]
MTTYPISAVREQFPALREGLSFLDGAGGTQLPDRVGRAIWQAATSAVCQRSLTNAAASRADQIVLEARHAMADFLDLPAGGIVFGRSATELTFMVARAMASRLQPGDEVAVSRLEHDANARPWVRATELSGATLRWIDFDPMTGDLDVAQAAAAINDRTRIVAITAASNLYGTMPPVAEIAALARAVGAEVYVDAVAYSAHHLPSATALGADYLVCSPYKFCGPHLGVLGAAPDRLERLHPDKVLPGTEQVPERFELGTLPYEMLAGVTETVDFLADLVGGEGNRRERLARSYARLAEYEEQLFASLLAGVAEVPGVELVGSPRNRIPSLLFRVAGQAPQQVAESLGARGITAMSGTFYAYQAQEWAGLTAAGAVRVGVAAYTDQSDITRFLTALHDIAAPQAA